MAKSSNQKGKLLALLRIFSLYSDEEHPLSVPQLVQYLEAAGISAERKSIYNDIEVLQSMDYDIQLQRGKGYFLGERDFQLAELKLLVDAVQSSRFISVPKSRQLIRKLEQMASQHQAQGLHRQVFVSGRVKSMNESIYYTIDAIHRAIGGNQQISFRYFKYNLARKKEYRHNNKTYHVSPYALLRSDDNYYLIAYDPQAQGIRHYRVDKMDYIRSLDQPRDGMEVYRSFDLAEYANLHFGMFHGETASVILRCKNDMADVMFDRFGDQLSLVPDGEGYFTCSVTLAVSPQFFGWLTGLGDGVTLVGPERVVKQYRTHLEGILGRLGPSL